MHGRLRHPEFVRDDDALRRAKSNARFVTGRDTEASERGDYSTLAPYQQARGDYGGLDLPSALDAYTKENWFPRSPTETVRSLQLAFKHATAGRPGPTAIILDGDAVTEEMLEDQVSPVRPMPVLDFATGPRGCQTRSR